MINRIFLFAILLGLSLSGYSASNQFKKQFETAESYFNDEKYDDALPLYLELFDQDTSNANIAYKVGLCYLNSIRERDKSVNYLSKAVRKVSSKYREGDYKETNAPLQALLYYGNSLHYVYKFDDAIEIYNKYEKLLPPDSPEKGLIAIQIENSQYAKSIVSKPITITVINLGDKINTASPEYAPVISADESTLIFTSRRPNTTGGKKDESDNYYEDIYISHKVNGEWTLPVSIGENINSFEHEASIGLSVDGQQLLIYKDDKGDGNIYISFLQGDVWSAPTRLDLGINSKAWEPSASLSSDGNTLFFVSDRKGGYGGRDIYKCVKLPNGEWAAPMNMGPMVNTASDEDGPFIHPDGQRLYFSSKGHKGLGGFDIFVSHANEEGIWQKPENIGYPINTTDDDIFYIPTASGKGAYYSSFREMGFGEKDIYYLSVPEQKEAELAVFKGTVKDLYGRVPKNVKIKVINNQTGEIVGEYSPNTKSGNYLFILPPGHNYNVTFEGDGYLFYSENVDVPEGTSYKVINKAIELSEIKVGSSVVLKNIFFDSGKASLRSESKPELDNLILLLKNNPSLTIELGGHTDNKGSSELNLKLSKDRANAVMEHIVNSGVDKSRVKAIGYGETKPVMPNQNPNGSDNKENMQINRRLEFKIIGLSDESIKKNNLKDDFKNLDK